MKKVLLYISIISVMFFGYACSELDSDIADQGTSPNASFPNASVSFEVVSSEGGKVTVQVIRGNVKTAADVGLTLTLASDIPSSAGFKLAQSTVSFPQGENTALATIEYDFDALELFKTYKLTLSFTDPAQGPLYGARATTTVNVALKLVYEDYMKGKYTSNLFPTLGIVDKEVMVQKAAGANYFKIVDPYRADYPLYFVMNGDRTDLEEFDIQELGVSSSTYGMIYINVIGFGISGNVMSFPSQGLVVYGGGWGLLYDTKIETLTMPAAFYTE